MPDFVQLSATVTLRTLREGDAAALLHAYVRNREHLAPWEPARLESFFTVEAQTTMLAFQLEELATGVGLPLALWECDRVVGRVTLSRIVRGPLQSASVGYFIDGEHTGSGLASAALAHTLEQAQGTLGLHRIEASTLLHNAGSQRVLRRVGFTQIGMAPEYLKIAGEWRDHLLFQRILGERMPVPR
ncbi:GNAT family N-acetyltransferase [Cryobacterium psychrophilum]|uniref:N-acetyltransferase n=1 Tax=Cryobacterium psychrophilum TaxID=41988 RepID=A0A4Y8KIQ1_9MICO|nr:GNAT family protein [Cryobacterium psychrophilum]TDW30050.1 [SSU ribosomal protein S5P]-alanine acetyltransferase [Cryobacterium psychrophilum]TFD75505.1 N-acetyltransferase [Cryobacterium psychrophilum]